MIKPTKREFRRYIEQQVWKDYLVETEIIKRPDICVEVSVGFGDRTYLGSGFAKVCYPDKWNLDEGLTIATAKAVADISKQIVEYLNRPDNSGLKLKLENEVIK